MTEEREKTVMPTRKFRELVQSMPLERQRKLAKRVGDTMAPMPLGEIRKARQMTQVRLAEVLGVNQGEISKIEHRTDRRHRKSNGDC
jgi:DNA-binding transcriptional regulator YiaG